MERDRRCTRCGCYVEICVDRRICDADLRFVPETCTTPPEVVVYCLCRSGVQATRSKVPQSTVDRRRPHWCTCGRMFSPEVVGGEVRYVYRQTSPAAEALPETMSPAVKSMRARALEQKDADRRGRW